MGFFSSFLTDPKRQAGMAAGLTTFAVQFAASKGFVIDHDTADAVSKAVVAVAGFFILGHAHVEHSENMAEAHVEAAKVTSNGGTS